MPMFLNRWAAVYREILPSLRSIFSVVTFTIIYRKNDEILVETYKMKHFFEVLNLFKRYKCAANFFSLKFSVPRAKKGGEPLLYANGQCHCCK